ncbi:MAG: recombination regulator RecX [Alphaproteobacteria bacterium]|nr:recombination regulator RecX [Alphaproteobacteria bacterium]
MDQDSPPKPKVKRKTPKKLSESYLRNSALYYLQRHPTSVSHFLEVMGRKMKRSARAHEGQDVDAFMAFVREKLVPEFERAGFLNDALYAKALTGSLQRKGLPKRAIAMKLAAKGVAADETQLAEQDDYEAARLFAKRKRLGPFATRAREPQKDLAALARAGFSYDVCQRVLKGEN